jgi:RNA ligase (TIGR02306 family)
MERKLASIQKIKDIQPIENADSIERIDVLGWHCVAKKGEFKINDLCVYMEVDSVLPDKPEFSFMKDRGFRVRTIKLRGQISQGICFPLNIISGNFNEGDDVTELVGVVKYEPIIPATMAGKIAGYFPAFVNKTDEMRIQTVPEVLNRHAGTKCYVTEKVDGCSTTAWIYNGEFGVASRNMRYFDTPDNIWWKAIHLLDIENKLKSLDMNIALQGELLGNVQGNKYKLNQPTIFWFNVFDIDAQQYYHYQKFSEFIKSLGLNIVPLVDDKFILNHTVDSLVECAKGQSKLAPIHREGIVIRPVNETLDIELGRLSFKVINPDFLLKFGE